MTDNDYKKYEDELSTIWRDGYTDIRTEYDRRHGHTVQEKEPETVQETEYDDDGEAIPFAGAQFFRSEKKEEKKEKDSTADYFARKVAEEAVPGVPEEELYAWKISREGVRYPDSPILDAWREYIETRYNVINIQGLIHIYDPEKGVYEPDAGKRPKRLMTTIRKCLREGFRKPIHINAITDLIVMDHDIDKDDTQLNQFPMEWINFKNGFLDVLTGEMHPHDAKYYSTNQVPHNYVPGISKDECILYDFLKPRIPDKEDEQMLYAFAGYCLTARRQFRNFLIITDNGHNGKSKLLECLRRILGPTNYSALLLQDLDSEFKLQSMYGKICNIGADLPVGAVKDSAYLKMATGGDEMLANVKFNQPIQFVSRAKLIFSANQIPKFLNENSGAVYDRMLVVRYTPSDYEIDWLDRKLSNEREIEAEISIMIAALKEELEIAKGRDEMRKSKNCLKEVEKVRCDSDTTHSFLSEVCTVKEGAKADRKALYEEYSQHCSEYGREALGKTAFFAALRAKGFQEVKNRGEWYFTGIMIGKDKVDERIREGRRAGEKWQIVDVSAQLAAM